MFAKYVKSRKSVKNDGIPNICQSVCMNEYLTDDS